MIATVPFPRLWPRPTLAWAIVGAWVLAIATQVTGTGRALHHHGLVEGGLPLAAALGLFLLAWQVHIAAAMLPTSLPLIRLFATVARPQPRPALTKAAFLSGYVLIWTLFGAAAFLGDVQLHHLVHAWPWLRQHEWVIAGSTLLVAGAFQFSGLKQRCLTECRHPAVYINRHYRRGLLGAFRLGRNHGLFCLGCCWALMLVMFGAGVANLMWMAPLALVMLIEKTARDGDRLAQPVGVGLLLLGMLVLAHPGWLPPVLGE
jgi:predicted metal-binding membrane protein